MLLSVLVSFKNEEENLGELIRRVRESLRGICQHEIVLVNDASTDGSLEILRNHINGGDIRILNTSRSFGHGPCLMAGLHRCAGDAVVYIDADLQDPPEMIPQLVAEYKKGFDVVMTVRKEREGETWLKKFITKRAYQVLHHVSPNTFVENAGDFRLISRRVVEQIKSLDERDGIFRGLVSWVGFRVAKIEYVRAPRYRGTSHHAFFTGVPARYFLNALVSFSNYPIYFAMGIGLLIGLSSLALGAVLMFLWPEREAWFRASTALQVVQVCLLGFITFLMGLFALYNARVYQQVRGRPDYIIESTEGFPESSIARKQA
ncbi:MAG: glycosyltransferase family 2 protein [Bdellovibrionales bacterium]